MFRRTLSIAAAAALVLAGALVVQPAAATDTPVIKTGNGTAECKAAGFDFGIKLDTGGDGTYVYGDGGNGPWEDHGDAFEISVTLLDSSFTFTATPMPAAILVKAGTHYDMFTPPFVQPLTPTVKFGISHITFCYDDGPQNEPDEHLTVTKTIDTSYNRDHSWTLTKDVSASDVWLYAPSGSGSGTGEVDWVVEVGYGGSTDSDHTVSGTITVLNDGDGATVLADVVDTMTIDGVPMVIDIECGDPVIDFEVDTVVLEVGQSVTCTYSEAVDGAVEGSNEAVATTLTGNDYSTEVAIPEWGDPDTETDATVTVTDTSDLTDPPTVREDTFSAPNGGKIEYSNTFNWDDYAVCGDYMVENTASLSAEGVDPVTKVVNIHVQCQTFQGETAWAANTTAGTLPYNKKGGSWATYVQYPKAAGVLPANTYYVYAGQNMLAGTATITAVTGGVQVTVDLMGDWEFADAVSNLKIQTYSSAPSGNPSPGLFAYKTSCTTDPCTSGLIPVAKFYGIHMDVGVWVPDPNFGP